MQIHRIRLRNLHSLRTDTEIDFTASPLAGCGLFAITGDTGAGKTTILDALTLALYGKVCRNSSEMEALSYGAEEGFAECEFESKGRRFMAQWNIRRRKSKKESSYKTERSVAEWDDKEGFVIQAGRIKKEVDTFIEEVTGLDFARFTRSVLLAQGEFATFLKAAPKERSDLLERITGTEIYSELSKAALQRYRIEEGLLQDLIKHREALKIFSKEEVKELKGFLKNQEEDSKQARSTLDVSKKALQWLREIETLEQRLQSATNALALLEEEKAAVKTDLERLEQHRKTVPFHTTLARLDDRLTEISRFETEIEKLSGDSVDLQKRESETRQRLEQNRTQLDELKSTRAASMRLFDEVAEMDVAIGSRESLLKKQQQEYDELARQQKEDTNRLSELEQELAGCQAALDESTGWLENNKALSSLSQDLPTINLLREQLRGHLIAKKMVEAEREQLKIKVENAGKEVVQLSGSLEKEKSLLGELTANFQKEAPKDFVLSRADLLEKITSEIESLGEQQKHLRQLNGLNDEYRRMLAELAILEEQLDNLRREELSLGKTLLSAMEETEEWEGQMQFRQEIYRQQLKIVNYEKDRAELAEGEPCPICQSTHHPFRSHGVKPFLDAAKQEFEKVEKSYKEAQARQKKVLHSHQEAATKINHLDGGPNGQTTKLQAKIRECEQKIVSLLPSLSEDEISRSHGAWLSERLTYFEQNLSSKRTVRDKLNSLHRSLEAQEKKVQSLQSKLLEATHARDMAKESLQHNERNIRDAEKQFDDATQRLNDKVKPYGYRFKMDEANGMFKDLEEKEKLYSENLAGNTEQQKQLALTGQELKSVTSRVQELEKKAGLLSGEIQKATASLDEFKAKRQELFGERNPKSEREKLLNDLDILEKSFAESRQQFEQVKAELVRSQQAVAHLTDSLHKSRKSLAGIEQTLNNDLSGAGFENLEVLRSAILPTDEANIIDQNSKAIRRQEIETRQQFKAATQELEAALKTNLTDRAAEDLTAEIENLEEQLQKVQRSIGALQQQLSDNDKRKEEAKSLLTQIDQQRKTFNRWAALYDLIGSGDGSKFRKFAQGLTLQKLVQLANVHLQNLFGRYVIIKRPAEDLELDIVDTYQADNVRSMHTLSGGESFLVSLALALGLSDLAGRDANIRSLFIDEGFGTLDDQALDLAITTLENLLSRGKTIGVISHVKELKERIATQIKVLKKGGGISVVEVTG